MKAYQIVDFENPVSVSYSKISRDSFRPAIEKGYISEIIPVQAVTPKTLHKYEHMFNWEHDLAEISGHHKTITPSEKSGNISHWLLMKQASETKERFFIMEHDALMLNSFDFKMCMDVMNEHDMSYANLGMFMSCYSYNRHCAKFCWDLLTEDGFPINCGPYGVAERLYKTYATNYLERNDYDGKELTFMTHYHDVTHVGVGRTAEKMFEVYNFNRIDEKRGINNPDTLPLPSTQVISRKLMITQDHEYPVSVINEQPWLRNSAFVVID